MTNFVPVSKESVKAIILNMHNPNMVAKEGSKQPYTILHFIVNSSLGKSHVLCCLKHSIITPVLKKSDLNTNEYKSFCPVSNLNFASKLIEKCVFLQIQSYLKYNHLFCQFQSAYRIGGPDGRCFLAAWAMSTLVLNMTDRNQTCQTEGYLPVSIFIVGLIIGKRPFQDGVMPGKNCPF